MPGATGRHSPVPGLRRWAPRPVAIGAPVEDAHPVDAGDATLGLLYPLVAALVLSRHPGKLVGRLLMVTVVTGPYLLAAQYVATGCLTKLHAASRAEAVALARDAGLGPTPS